MTDTYTLPSGVLRNLLNIDSREELDRAERLLATQRLIEGCPTGNFDLKHLQAIHHHLFQDIYDWAGEVRTVEMTKEASQFQFKSYIQAGMADVHRRIEEANYLRKMTPDTFAEKAGQIIGDVNYVHPFREGNGRTQLEYLRQLAEQAGHTFDAAKLDQERWIQASRAAHEGDYTIMQAEIRAALDGQQDRERTERQQIAARRRPQRDQDRDR